MYGETVVLHVSVDRDMRAPGECTDGSIMLTVPHAGIPAGVTSTTTPPSSRDR